MKKLSNLLILSLFSIMVFAFAASAVLADEGCTPIYGGGQTCIQKGNVTVDKIVLDPKNNQYVNGLSVNESKYSPNQNVSFKIIVSNGNTSVTKVTVKDVFPQNVRFVSGPGKYDSNTNTLTFDIGDLKSGESKTYTVVGKIDDSSKFPPTGTICEVNQVIITADNGQTAQDNTQFCIETKSQTTKGGLPVEPAPKIITTPATGPEMLPLLALLPGGLAGFILRKKSRVSK